MHPTAAENVGLDVKHVGASCGCHVLVSCWTSHVPSGSPIAHLVENGDKSDLPVVGRTQVRCVPRVSAQPSTGG